MFIGTFVYCLVVLRTVRSADAAARGFRVELLIRPNDVVRAGDPIARVAPDGPDLAAVATELCEAVDLGDTRTAQQAPDFHIDELVEVGTRALSPAINDPFTAMACLDWLGAALACAAAHPARDRIGRDGTGVPRVRLQARRVTDLLRPSFVAIRPYALASPLVVARATTTP